MCGQPIGDRRVASSEVTTDSRPGAQCPLTPTTGSALRPSRYLVVVGAGEMESAHGRYIPEEVRKCLTWVAECKRQLRGGPACGGLRVGDSANARDTSSPLAVARGTKQRPWPPSMEADDSGAPGLICPFTRYLRNPRRKVCRSACTPALLLLVTPASAATQTTVYSQWVWG